MLCVLINFNLMVMFRPIRYVDSESFVMEVTYAVTESLHVTEHFAFGVALFFFSVFSVLSSFSPIFLQPFHFVFRSVSFFRYFYEFQILTRVFQVFCNSVLIYVFYFLLFFSFIVSFFSFLSFFLSFTLFYYHHFSIFSLFPSSVLTVIQTLLVMSSGFQAACVTFLLRFISALISNQTQRDWDSLNLTSLHSFTWEKSNVIASFFPFQNSAI